MSDMIRTAIAIAVLAGCSIGCTQRDGILGVDRCADFPRGAVPPPAGTSVCEWQTAQVASAISDQGVFYLADFIGDTGELSPAAIERIARHAHSGLAASLQWTIQPSGDVELDQQRLQSVARAVNELGIAADGIRVAHPAALGLPSQLAEQVAAGQAGGRGRTAPAARPFAAGAVPVIAPLPFTGGVF